MELYALVFVKFYKIAVFVPNASYYHPDKVGRAEGPNSAFYNNYCFVSRATFFLIRIPLRAGHRTNTRGPRVNALNIKYHY